MKSGELMLIANGRKTGVLQALMRGEMVGTLFLGGKNHLRSRKRWIAFNVKSMGSISIDPGAVRALVDSKKSLLATGVVDVSGKFNPGDAADVLDPGERSRKGVSNYSAVIERYGKKTREIREIPGGTHMRKSSTVTI